MVDEKGFLGLFAEATAALLSISASLSIISKRLDKMDINQQGSMAKLIDLFKSDRDVPIV